MKSSAQIMATQLYMSTLLEHFDWPKLGKLHKLLEDVDKDENSEDFWKSCYKSKRLYKNMRGTCCIKDQILIDKVERIIPGSQRILNTPLWDILENPNASEELLHQMMQKLPVDISKRLFKQSSQHANPIRKSLTKRSQIHAITMMGTLDSLACCLMLVREMDLQNRLDPYIEAKWAVYWSLLLISQKCSIRPIANSLLELIDQDFISKNGTLPKRLKKEFIQIKPSAFEAPTIPLTLAGFYQTISGLIWHVQYRDLIGKSEEDKNKFIFYTIKNYSLKETAKAIRSLPLDYRLTNDSTPLPHPLNLIMYDYSGDQRSAMAAIGFMD